jgi:hypothetical protein
VATIVSDFMLSKNFRVNKLSAQVFVATHIYSQFLLNPNAADNKRLLYFLNLTNTNIVVNQLPRYISIAFAQYNDGSGNAPIRSGSSINTLIKVAFHIFKIRCRE